MSYDAPSSYMHRSMVRKVL